MDKTKQRIAIAKACGWTNVDKYLGREPIPFTREYLGGTDDGLPEGEDTLGHPIKPIPKYPEDLNAMHEAEKALTTIQASKYTSFLANKVTESGITNCASFHKAYIGMPAAQRAEAFLRAIGKWEE